MVAIYEILKVPNKVLTTPAKRVEKITPNVLRVLDNMYETMKFASGVGLAAPQVNILKRMAVVDAEDGMGRLDLINPEVLEGRDLQMGADGCLSIPGIYGETERYAWIRVRMQTRTGEIVEFEESGFRARVIQHEIDHLDGILYTTKTARLFREEEPAGTAKRRNL